MTELKEIKPEYADYKIEKQTRAEDVFGKFKLNQVTSFFSTSTSIPSNSNPPRNWLEQIIIYTGAVPGIYYWQTSDSTWHFIQRTS